MITFVMNPIHAIILFSRAIFPLFGMPGFERETEHEQIEQPASLFFVSFLFLGHVEQM